LNIEYRTPNIELRNTDFAADDVLSVAEGGYRVLRKTDNQSSFISNQLNRLGLWTGFWVDENRGFGVLLFKIKYTKRIQIVLRWRRDRNKKLSIFVG